MADLIGNILVGYAAAAWAQGFRACDRTMIGMLLGVSDEDLGIICGFLSKWEKEEAVENV
jgi:hypothetical protein